MSETAEAIAAHSGDWWQRRTQKELQDFVRGGFARGEAYFEAQREIERRAGELVRRQAEEERARKELWRRKTGRAALIAASISALLSVVALATEVFRR